jgi:hypothetical protein
VQVKKADDDGNLSGWIETLGVDPSYRPPPERSVKPVACFYIQLQGKTGEKPDFYRAIYPMQRTLEDFKNRIAAKWGLDSSIICRTVHVIKGGLEVEMDDDVIRELKEGQDMILEIEETVEQPPAVKREWEMSLDASDESPPTDAPTTATKGLNLKLTF